MTHENIFFFLTYINTEENLSLTEYLVNHLSELPSHFCNPLNVGDLKTVFAYQDNSVLTNRPVFFNRLEKRNQRL